MNLSDESLKTRVAMLRWLLPLSLSLVTVLYQIWSVNLAHNFYDETIHLGVEFLFYATAGPLLLFVALTRFGRWLDEKQEAEQHARASEQRLASIVAASADAILSVDAQGRIESWNRGAELIFGFPAQVMQGRALVDLFASREAAGIEFAWLVDTVRREGFVRGHETTCRTAEGQSVTVELTATRLTDKTAAERSMSVILRDITERKQREAEIRRLNANLREQVAEQTHALAEKVDALAEANAELEQLDAMRSEFLSLVSHQLRAPLTNMVGAVERIERDCPAMTLTCGRMMPVLNQQVERLDRLVRDVLNMTRIESGALVVECEPISLLPVVRQVVDQLRMRRLTRPIHLPIKPGLPLVFADRNQLAEVLSNLLDNADKYSPPKAVVEIDVRADQNLVTLAVRDFGPGVPAADLERIFDKFRRLDGGDAQAGYGYGLGLYICRRLLEAQGGRIWAENHPQGGAVFSISLPVAQEH